VKTLMIAFFFMLIFALSIPFVYSEERKIEGAQSKTCWPQAGVCRAVISKKVRVVFSDGSDYVLVNVIYGVGGSPAYQYSFSGRVAACSGDECNERTVSHSGISYGPRHRVWEAGVERHGTTSFAALVTMEGWSEGYIPNGTSTNVITATIYFSGVASTGSEGDSDNGGNNNPAQTKLTIESNVQTWTDDAGYVTVSFPMEYSGRIHYEVRPVTPEETVISNVRWHLVNFSVNADEKVTRTSEISLQVRVNVRSGYPLGKWISKDAYSGYFETIYLYFKAEKCSQVPSRILIVGRNKMTGEERIIFEKNGIGWGWCRGSFSLTVRNVTLHNEKIVIKSSIYGFGDLKLIKKEYQNFSYWELYDEQGSLINILTGRNASISVPLGAHYTLKAYYNSTPNANSILHVISKPISGVKINYSGSLTGEGETDFYLLGAHLNVTLKAPKQWLKRVLIVNEIIRGRKILVNYRANTSNVYLVRIEGSGALIAGGRVEWVGADDEVVLALWPNESLVFEGLARVEVFRLWKYRFVKWEVSLLQATYETNSTKVDVYLGEGSGIAAVYYNTSTPNPPIYLPDLVLLREERIEVENVRGNFTIWGSVYAYTDEGVKSLPVSCLAPKPVHLPPWEEFETLAGLGENYVAIKFNASLPECGAFRIWYLAAPATPGNYSYVVELDDGYFAGRVSVILPALSVIAVYHADNVTLRFFCPECRVLKPLAKDVELQLYLEDSGELKTISRNYTDTPGNWSISIPYRLLSSVEDKGEVTLVARLEWERTGFVVSEELRIPVKLSGLEITRWNCGDTYFILKPDVQGAGWRYEDLGKAYVLYGRSVIRGMEENGAFKFELGVDVCRVPLGSLTVVWIPPPTLNEILYPVRLKL